MFYGHSGWVGTLLQRSASPWGNPCALEIWRQTEGWLHLIMPSLLWLFPFLVAYLHSSFLCPWKRPLHIQSVATLHPGQRSTCVCALRVFVRWGALRHWTGRLICGVQSSIGLDGEPAYTRLFLQQSRQVKLPSGLSSKSAAQRGPIGVLCPGRSRSVGGHTAGLGDGQVSSRGWAGGVAPGVRACIPGCLGPSAVRSLPPPRFLLWWEKVEECRPRWCPLRRCWWLFSGVLWASLLSGMRDLPRPGIEPVSLHWQTGSYPLYHQGQSIMGTLNLCFIVFITLFMPLAFVLIFSQCDVTRKIKDTLLLLLVACF